jgi:5'-3' exonuclease
MLGLSTHELHFYILRESVENDRANDRGGKVQRGGRGQHSEYHKKVREELAKDDIVKKSGGLRF